MSTFQPQSLTPTKNESTAAWEKRMLKLEAKIGVLTLQKSQPRRCSQSKRCPMSRKHESRENNIYRYHYRYGSVGKRASPSVMAETATEHYGSRLFYQDRNSITSYLIDSGAEISLLPSTSADQTSSDQPPYTSSRQRFPHQDIWPEIYTRFSFTGSALHCPLLAFVPHPSLTRLNPHCAVRAFEEVTTLLTDSLMIAYQEPEATLTLSEDTSQIAVGSVLEHRKGIVVYTLVYLSVKLSSTHTPQMTDPELQELRKPSNFSPGIPRPFFPKTFRRQVFRSLHYLSHPDKRTKARLVLDYSIWPSCYKDIANWTKYAKRARD
ncbi:hypothetical protein ACTXT7_015993 [Hymenolepis weldensis]